MFGRMIPLCLFALLVFGCARPNYESVQNLNGWGTTTNQKVSDCQIRFQSSGLCLLWSWEELPTAKVAGVLQFKVVRANALDDSPMPVDSEFTPSVLLWMPDMGHGSSPTNTTRVDVGSYRVTNVFFIMPGQWEIRFQIKDGEILKDEAVAIFTF